MVILTPGEVREKFGQFFSKRFLVMVDEKGGQAEIIEQCCHQGTIEWDAMNRRRAGGSLTRIRLDGTTLTMTARIGTYPVNFGPASADIGGQALEGVTVSGDEVITHWAGIAGAGVGIAACLPQAPGVLRTEYPSEDDLNVGGARIARSRIISPRYEKIVIGIDDTDTRESGATWVLALKCAENCRIDGVEFITMRLVQFNPEVPNKTTNCVGAALVFAVRPGRTDELLTYVREFIEERAISHSTGIAYYTGIGVTDPESPYFRAIKKEILTVRDAEEEAARQKIIFIDSFGSKGRIGAIGALLWASKGVEAAGLYGEDL